MYSVRTNVFYLPREWGDLMERDNVEGLSVEGKIILKWIFQGGKDWIHFAEDRNRWLALVNAEMSVRAP